MNPSKPQIAELIQRRLEEESAAGLAEQRAIYVEGPDSQSDDIQRVRRYYYRSLVNASHLADVVRRWQAKLTEAEARLAAAQEALRGVAQNTGDPDLCWCYHWAGMGRDHSDYCKQARAALSPTPEDTK